MITPKGAYVSLEQLQQLRLYASRYQQAHRCQHRQQSGQHLRQTVSRGMSFEDVRPYQTGDDVRCIDWKVTARMQKTHIKRYTEEKEKPIITAIDQRPSLFFGSSPCFKSVYACYLAALINWRTLLMGDRSGGSVLGIQGMKQSLPSRYHQSVNRWLEQLSAANQQLSGSAQSKIHLNQWLAHLAQHSPTGAVIYVISDFYDLNKETGKWLYHLRQHHYLQLICVKDKLEDELPTQTLAISNGKENQRIKLTPQQAKAFKQQVNERHQNLQMCCKNLQVPLYMTQIQTPLSDTLYQLSL